MARVPRGALDLGGIARHQACTPRVVLDLAGIARHSAVPRVQAASEFEQQRRAQREWGELCELGAAPRRADAPPLVEPTR